METENRWSSRIVPVVMAAQMLVAVFVFSGCTWHEGLTSWLGNTPRATELDTAQVASDVNAYRFALRYGFEMLRDGRYDVVEKGVIRNAVRNEVERIAGATDELHPYTLEDARQALVMGGMTQEDAEATVGQMVQFIGANPLEISQTGSRDTMQSFLFGCYIGMSNAMQNVDALERMTR